MPKTRTTTPAQATAASAASTTPSMKALLDLLSADHGATAAELAGHAGIGRSTAAKILAALESAGSARREPGARAGQRPEPDRWFASTRHPAPARNKVPASETATSQHGEPRDEQPGEAEGVHETLVPETAPDGEAEPDTADTAARAEAADSPQSAALAAACVNGAPATGATPTGGGAPAVAARQAAPAEPAAPARLAKGGLRALVVDYLTGHPGEEMTAPRIGKSLGRSSGAVANLCGLSESVSVDAETEAAAVESGRVGLGIRPARRLVKGELQGLVLEVLRAGGGREFSPLQIARWLDSSSGAVSNALDRLVASGDAVLVCEAPRRFAALPSSGSASAEDGE